MKHPKWLRVLTKGVMNTKNGNTTAKISPKFVLQATDDNCDPKMTG